MLPPLSPSAHQLLPTDPEELDLPVLKKPFHFYKDRSEAPKVLQDTNKLIEEADCFVVITAEYNHCMPPALTNLMDHFPIASYKYRPSGITCYSMGSFGGVRASMQARSLLGELGTPSVCNIFAIPQIQNALSPDGEPQNDHMDRGAEKLLNELEWYASGLKKQRETVGKPK